MTQILTSSNVDTLDNKPDIEQVIIDNLSQKTGGITSSDVNRSTVTQGQKELVKGTHAENLSKQKKMDKESITPIGNYCIVEVKLAQSLIQMPGGSAKGAIESIKLWKTSARLKTSMPELQEGKYCNVNMQLILQVGGTPCYEDGNLLYFKVSGEQIEYLYDVV